MNFGLELDGKSVLFLLPVKIPSFLVDLKLELRLGFIKIDRVLPLLCSFCLLKSKIGKVASRKNLVVVPVLSTSLHLR
jgi:hypothetical protein